MRERRELPLIGWREWIALPAFGIPRIKVKVDTGARSSALHAFDIEPYRARGRDWVRFKVHPVQRAATPEHVVEAPLVAHRRVRNTSGRAELRPVVMTTIALLGREWPIELTLASRDQMGFRMLLGRQAVRRRFHVDPSGSYFGGRPKRKKKSKKKRK